MTTRDFLYIIRKDFISYWNAISTVVIDYPNISIYKKTKTEKIERFVAGKTNFNGFEINDLDYHSYDSTLKELFDQKIYLFNSRNEEPFIIDCGANIGLSILFFKLNIQNLKLLLLKPIQRYLIVFMRM